MAKFAVLCALLGLAIVANAYDVDAMLDLPPFDPQATGVRESGLLNKQDLVWNALPSFDELPNAFKLLFPGGNTICGDGSPFGFLIKKGDPNKVLIELEAGGLCYDYASCVLGPFSDNQAIGAYEYSLNGNVTVPSDFATNFGSSVLFNEGTATSNYTKLYISYCTGDFMVGNTVMNYPQYSNGTGAIRTQYHNGIANTLSALAYLKSIVPNPEHIVLTGCSSGAVATNPYIRVLHDLYDGQGVKFSVFADSFTGVSAPLFSFLLYNWGNDAICAFQDSLLAYGDITVSSFFLSTMTTEGWYVAAARDLTDTDFFVFSNILDPVLYSLYNVGLLPSPFPTAPSDLFLVETRAWVSMIVNGALPNLHLWIDASGPHCRSPGSYSFTKPDVVAAYNGLVTGEASTNTICSTCALTTGTGCSGTDKAYDLCYLCGGDSSLCSAFVPVPTFYCVPPQPVPTWAPPTPSSQPSPSSEPTTEPTPTEEPSPSWEPTPTEEPSPLPTSAPTCDDKDDVLAVVAASAGYPFVTSCSQISRFCYNPYFFNFLSFLCPATCLSDNNDLLSELAGAAGFGWINRCSQVKWLCNDRSVGYAMRVICGQTCAGC